MMPIALKTRMLTALVILALIGMGILFGSIMGYSRGYRHGQTITNGWWIEKQSRYYDSFSVDQKRRLKDYDLI